MSAVPLALSGLILLAILTLWSADSAEARRTGDERRAAEAKPDCCDARLRDDTPTRVEASEMPVD